MPNLFLYCLQKDRLNNLKIKPFNYNFNHMVTHLKNQYNNFI